MSNLDRKKSNIGIKLIEFYKYPSSFTFFKTTCIPYEFSSIFYINYYFKVTDRRCQLRWITIAFISTYTVNDRANLETFTTITFANVYFIVADTKLKNLCRKRFGFEFKYYTSLMLWKNTFHSIHILYILLSLNICMLYFDA